ncbi:S1 family peptidase [Pseudopelagicola sp. nBUS_20]|uniref:S1 family peptidase n=1 Tax=Pseudopelagicola sp. nBUS_20 TaxID=3395317 RepID=UPI003EC0EAD9
MRYFKGRFTAALWPFIVTALILALLLLYIAIPGNLHFRSPSVEDTNLETEQSRLQIELEKLKDVSEKAVCVGDHLVVPHDKSLTPPLPEKRSSSKGVSTLLDKLGQSVVLIIVEFDDDDRFSIGSGFFVSPSTIMTNGHVVTHDEKKSVKKISILNAAIGNHKATLRKIDYDENKSTDFALLSVDGGVMGFPLQFANIENPAREKLKDVFAAGFPGNVIESDDNFVKLMNSEGFLVPDLVVTDGKINSHQNIYGNASAFFHTALISSGNSGGPLVNSCGEVVAINTWTKQGDGNARNISLSALGIQSFLVDSNVKPRVSVVECVDGK